MQITDYTSWFVWLVPLISSFFVPLIGRFSAKARNAFVLAIASVTAFFAFTLIPAVSAGITVNIPVSWIPGINAGIFLDPLSVLFTCLIGFFGLIIAIYSIGYMKHEENLTRYYFFLLVFIGSMIGLVISDNFLQMFIFWEMVGMCSYALISFWNSRPESVKAGNKVFLMTRIGDIMLLAAIAILYISFGTFSFHGTMTAMISQVNAGTLNTGLMVTVAFLVLGGAIAKSAQLPFFTWLYSAMEAPTSVSALLHAATMVKAGIYLIARFILIGSVAGPLIVALQPLWLPTVAWIGVITALIGATLALTTSDIKGVLAYSTVSQLGFMMAALGSSGLEASSSLGWFASLFHMMSHAFFEGLGFLLAGGIIHAVGTRDMRLMGGLKKAMPITFALAIVMIITTSGLPPFAAFFSKGLVITSITDAGNLLQVILIYATTAITFAYSLRFMKLVFLGKESEHIEKLHLHEAPKIMLAPAVALAVACCIWGFLMPALGAYMGIAVPTLLESFIGLETAIFAIILVPAGLLVYATYWKNYSIMNAIRSPKNPIVKLLNHGYFVDEFYEKGVAKATMVFSKGIKGFETIFFDYIPVIFANSAVRFADGVHKYFDVAADQLLIVIAGRSIEGASKVKTIDTVADKILDIISRRTVRSSAKARKTPVNSLQHYLAAALVGFIMLVILIIISVRGL
jgi:NADH-quinone oxidoreductase subunit L